MAEMKRNKVVDPGTNEPIQDAKRPKLQLFEGKKVACLQALVTSYKPLLRVFIPEKTEKMDTGSVDDDFDTIASDLSVSTQLTNIIFTLHTFCRQRAMGTTETNVYLSDLWTNVSRKSTLTQMTITYRGKAYSKDRKDLLPVWKVITKDCGLEYKRFMEGDQSNWYGTMGPYLDVFCGFGLRLKELRVGHYKMPVNRSDGVNTEIPVRMYGLSDGHHLLLEGCTFPLEKRFSMAQIVGPMTAFLCMVRSEGMYHLKWASAVKRAFNHLQIIDNIIEVTKTHKRPSDIRDTIRMLAEIMLITTSRQASRMFFPLVFLVHCYHEAEKNNETYQMLSYFNTTGSGGFALYKFCSRNKWQMNGSFTEEAAGQVVFHCIFGTYNEDLGILASITDVAHWQTREMLGKGFTRGANHDKTCIAKLPLITYYSKMSYDNRSGLLPGVGVYNQVASVSVFAGKRIHLFGTDFFEHLEKKTMVSSTGNTLPAINAALSQILEDLYRKITANKGKLSIRTIEWRSTDKLNFGVHGDVVDFCPSATGQYYFMLPNSQPYIRNSLKTIA